MTLKINNVNAATKTTQQHTPPASSPAGYRRVFSLVQVKQIVFVLYIFNIL
jgi:hypothetical protein